MSKTEFTLEYVIKASPKLLYNYLVTPSGLSEWFANNVNSRGEKYTFIWDQSEEVAILLKKKQDNYVRFQWEEDEDTEYFFEMRLQLDALTNDLSLMITDYAEPDEMDEARLLWDNLIDDLKQVVGA